MYYEGDNFSDNIISFFHHIFESENFGFPFDQQK